MIMTWPAELPPPQRDSWQLTRQDPRRRRQSDVGPPSYRRRSSASAKLLTMSIVLTRSQKAVFDNFYDIDCRSGVRLFRMRDPSTDGWALLDELGRPLLDQDGRRLLISKMWLCAWGDQVPTETVVEQVKFRMSFNITVIR